MLAPPEARVSAEAMHAWAARRARIGLMLGPVTLLAMLAFVLTSGFSHGDPRLGELWLAITMFLASLAAFITHLASLFELAITLTALRRSPRPTPVLVLAVYWLALAALLATGLIVP